MSKSENSLNEIYGFERPFKVDPLAEKATSYIKTGKKILDIGCGEGADSAYFSMKGFHVDAIDNNETDINRLKAYVNDTHLSNITIRNIDVLKHQFPANHYDAINCLLVGCCMMRSEFEKMLVPLKQALKPGGIMIMSLRNYLDPEFEEYTANYKAIEPNTFLDNDDCCKIRYYIEKDRLKEIFTDYEILHYYEGLIPDKFKKVPLHGDSNIICRNNIISKY